jgi:glycogen debranching enzyme
VRIEPPALDEVPGETLDGTRDRDEQDVARPATEPPTRQPYLHDLVTVLRAPGVALSGQDGQIRSGVHGVFSCDRRLISTLAVAVDGHEATGVRATSRGPGRVRFLGVLRELGDTGADPTVTLQRDREVVPDGLVETVVLNSRAREVFRARVTVDVGCDLADMAAVKSGRFPAPLSAREAVGGLIWDAPDGSMVRVTAEPRPTAVRGTTLEWATAVGRGEPFTLTLRVEHADAPLPVVLPSAVGVRPEQFSVRSDDHRLSALIEQSLADLDSLCLADPLAPEDRFLAAGSPWFLTLFGRDAIWTARMLLPLGTEIAGGTLRALARRQGTVHDPESAQEPGKIMHEIRPGETEHASEGFRLPPLYYGTVDATALWVSLLHDAWRWGMPADEVAELLPAAERAMGWITEHGPAANGFVSYRDATGRGLANQGWKDSGDSVQFRDGRLAEPPIALCEVQGYAYAAACQAADLFDAFGLPGADRWREWAAELADRFRAGFWLDDADGAYPAIALDADGRAVDTVTSNIAHLLGTGLLDADEERAVVARLARPDMDSGYGLRTMSSASAGFNPLAYHGGSVWTHDTAIAIAGLSASAAPTAQEVAGRLAEGLLAAAPSFEFRLPELFGGHSRTEFGAAVPYPAACRPQAWSAAASIAAVTALLGLRPDAPASTVRLRPARPCPVGGLDVRGLRLGDASFDVSVDAEGAPTVHGLPREVRTIVE